MPVVPVEENKVGIAGLTDARLRPGDFSGSGLDALGSGLRLVGGAGEELGKALGIKSPAPKNSVAPSKGAEANQRDVKTDMVDRPVKTLAEQAPKQTPKQVSDDAAVKEACNRYFENVRPSLDPASLDPASLDPASLDPASIDPGNEAGSEKQAGLAPPGAARVIQARDEAAADLTPEQHEAYHIAIARRVDQDLNWVQGLADDRTKVVRQQQSLRVMNNSAQDAILQYGSAAFGEHMATGLKQIDEQAAANGWTPEAKAAAETGFISRVHRGVSDSLSVSDPVLAADHLRVFGDHMTAEDRAAAWQSLQGPLIQTQAVADLDTLTIARSATAPLTPHDDFDRLMRRMLAITPGATGTDANSTTDLPELLDRYGGDAAKAWAASAMGADALDALVARRGAGWFAALQADTRTAVAANMAMLEAVSSPRAAPTPEERAQLAGEIEIQPWFDERKQNAYDELNTRIALGARRDKEDQDTAKESGLALADQLGPGFISINQLPPAVRDKLAPDALAALTLRAERNVHPAPVAGDGDVAWLLNRAAALDPPGFSRKDLRLYRDRMTPAEYEALSRTQEAWGSYPPSANGVTQQRSTEKVSRSGLDLHSLDDVMALAHGSGGAIMIAASFRADAGASAAVVGAGIQPAVDVNGVAGRVSTRDGTAQAPDGPGAPPLAPGQPKITPKAPIDLSLPTGTPKKHPPGKYRDPTNKNRTMAGNQYVRGGDIPDENGAMIHADLKNPLIKSFLDLLGWSEGTTKDQWNTRHRNDPPLTDLTKFPYRFKQPVGRYQIEPNTYDEIAIARLGLSDFSPETQDMTAAMHFRLLKVTDALQQGDLAGAIRAASRAWASIPVSAKENHSGLPVMVDGKPKISPKTGGKVYQSAHDYSQVVATYISILKRNGVPESVINKLKY